MVPGHGTWSWALSILALCSHAGHSWPLRGHAGHCCPPHSPHTCPPIPSSLPCHLRSCPPIYMHSPPIPPSRGIAVLGGWVDTSGVRVGATARPPPARHPQDPKNHQKLVSGQDFSMQTQRSPGTWGPRGPKGSQGAQGAQGGSLRDFPIPPLVAQVGPWGISLFPLWWPCPAGGGL